MKKIALIVDADNWAFANIARNICNRLSDYYEFLVIPVTYLGNNMAKVWLATKDCDLVHLLWRGLYYYHNYNDFDNYILELGGDVNTFKKEFIFNQNVSTDVYDHLFLPENDGFEITKYIFSKCKNYYVSSKKLYDIYNKLPIKYKPWGVITDGVDLEKFYPQNLKKFENINDRKIVVGWVGNSKWQDDGSDHKGVNTIIKPVIEQLIKEGYPLEMYFADKNERFIPNDEMVDYYSKIDIYICASESEGTPNPVLEAMACGVPVISTDVGIVTEALGKRQQKYILKERTKEDLKNKILKLLQDKDEFKKLSEENLQSIQSWSWDEKVKLFKDFFDYCLK